MNPAARTAERRRPSLVAALFLRLGGLLGGVVVAISVIVYWNAVGESARLHDEDLQRYAGVVRNLMSEELETLRESPPHSGPAANPLFPLLSGEDLSAIRESSNGRAFWVWRNHVPVEAAADRPHFADPGVFATGGLSDARDSNGQAWRLYSAPVPHSGVLIAVAEPMSRRSILTREDILGIALPLAVLVAAGLLVLLLFVRDGLSEVGELVRSISRRSPQDLSSLHIAGWSPDLWPLLRAMNGLFARVADHIARESRFVEHAAHQLRTPIAVVKLQAQLLSREADEAKRVELARMLGAGMDRAAVLVEKLLTLARVNEGGLTEAVADVDREVASVLQEYAPMASTRDVSLALEGRGGKVEGSPLLVRLIVANLVENAIGYAPAGSEVTVQLSATPSACTITVSDFGPGIPASQREKVFERFHQGPNSQGRGSGLGLAIVSDAAAYLGATVRLRDRADGRSGLVAEVEIPAGARQEGTVN